MENYHDDMYKGSYVYGKKCGHGKKYYTWGDVYEGNWHNDLQNGTGSMMYANGDHYSGNWKDGEIEGYGVMKYADGSMYEGCFKKGFKEGYGKHVDVSNNYEYEGMFKADQMCGHGDITYRCHGDITYNKKSTYSGFFDKNMHNGNGKMEYENGDKYDGEWKDGLRDGRGVAMMCDKMGNKIKVEGEWKDDNIVGVCDVLMYGGDRFIGRWDDYVRISRAEIPAITDKDHPPTVVFKNGDIYVGELSGMVPSGTGIMSYALSNQNVVMYKGRWMDWKYNGHGELLYKNGTRYIGEWVDDKMYGKGRIVYENGDIYNGEWERGYYVGKGEYISKSDGSVIKYIHKENGDVMIYEGDRLVYEGNHNNLMRHGYGRETDRDGCVYEGNWKDGVRDSGKITLPNGKSSYLCIYKNDRLRPLKMLDTPKSEINLLKEYLKVKRQRDEMEDCVEVVTKKYKKSLDVVENALIGAKEKYKKSVKILNNLSDFVQDKQSKDSEGIPYILTCPLTLEVMKDPVVCSDGNTYERDAIKAHLAKKNTSPLNREIMDKNVMISNQSVKSLIDIWRNIKECNENSKFSDVPQIFNKIATKPVKSVKSGSSGKGRGMSAQPVASRPVVALPAPRPSGQSGPSRPSGSSGPSAIPGRGRGRGMSSGPMSSGPMLSDPVSSLQSRPSGRGRGELPGSVMPSQESVQLLIEQNDLETLDSNGNELLEYMRMMENESSNLDWFV